MIPCRTIQKRIWKSAEIVSENCRLCSKSVESVPHIMDGCSMLAPKQYTERHDNMLRVYYKLLVIFGFTDQIYPWYKKDYVETDS